MFQRIVYLVNPASQNGATGRLWPDIAKHLPRAAEVLRTTGPGEALTLARAATDGGADLVVSVGGDGTLNEVVSGLMLVPEKKRPALAMVPQGTGGDFRRTLGYPTHPAAIGALINRGRTRALDVGRLQYRPHGGGDAVRHFINICSFGLSGKVDEAVNGTSKALGGKASFLIGTIRAFLSYRPADVEVSLDDGPWEKRKITTLAVANGRAFGGGMFMAPTADPADGLFEVVSVAPGGIKDVFAMSQLYKGDHIGEDNVRYESAKRVRAKSDTNVLLDVDGEQLGSLPIEIELLPGAIRFVV